MGGSGQIEMQGPAGRNVGSRSSHRLTLAAIAGILLLLGWLLPVFLTNRWSPDTIWQYEQAISGQLSDHHPPVMAALWRLLGAAPYGGKLVISAQLLLFAASAWLLLSQGVHQGERAKRLFAAALLLLLPTSVALLGVIWKDVHMALAWGLAWTLLFAAMYRPQHARMLRILAVPLILYGALVRYNAFIAVPPLLLMLLVGRPWTGRRWPMTIIAYAAIMVGTLTLSHLVNYRLLGAQRVQTAQLSLPIFDLAAITSATGKNAFPFPISADQIVQISRCYDPDRWDTLYFDGSPCRWLMTEMMQSQAAGVDVTSHWIRTSLTNPVPYALHRIAFANRFLCVADCFLPLVYRAHVRFDLTRPPVEADAAYYLTRLYVTYVDFGARIGLIKPIVVLFWSFLIVAVARRRQLPQDQLIIGACMVAILNLLSHVPFGVASDQRYAYPSYILVTFATIGFLLARNRPSDVKTSGAPSAHDRAQKGLHPPPDRST